MTAVIRVKRRVDEEPLSAFVLNGKKRRLDKEDKHSIDDESINFNTTAPTKTPCDEISTVLKFAGTITEQDNEATTKLARRLKNSKDEAVSLIQSKSSSRKPGSYAERSRAERKQQLQESRFRVVNCHRTAFPDEVEAGGDDGDSVANNKAITILDIEKQAKNEPTATKESKAQKEDEKSSEALTKQTNTNYVYDLYLPENEQQANDVDLMDDNFISVRAFDDLFYGERYIDEDDDEDSEDSNREDYYTNDYPDEEDEVASQSSECDEDRELRKAIRNFIIDEDDDSYRESSSSEDDDYLRFEDPYVQSIDTQNTTGFVDDVDSTTFHNDVNCYGKAYAQYKRRVLKQPKIKNLGEVSSSNDDDDDDDDNDN